MIELIHIFAATAAQCTKVSFFGLKPWYQYLTLSDPPNCVPMLDLSNPQNWSQLWLIGIVVFEDLLRIAGIVAVGYVIYGGINYQTSQGEPENTHRARQTITNAMIGVVIAVLGSAAVNFIGNRLGG